jgi:hypothetical protein
MEAHIKCYEANSTFVPNSLKQPLFYTQLRAHFISFLKNNSSYNRLVFTKNRDHINIYNFYLICFTYGEYLMKQYKKVISDFMQCSN